MSETTNPSTESTSEPQTFSVDYVRELRNENKSYRHKASELEARVKVAEEAVAKTAKEWEAKIAEHQTAAQQRLIRAELKAFASKAGMVDPDGLKLLDLSSLSLNDTGDVEGAEALIEKAKESKPWLFGISTSTSTNSPSPQPRTMVSKSAKEMSAEELSAFEAKLGIRV